MIQPSIRSFGEARAFAQPRLVAPPDGVGQREACLRDNRMLLVTGGAGFIGSNVVASLNEAGRTDIAVNDCARHRRQMAQPAASASSPTWCRRPTCSRWLEGRKLDAVIHLGAISDTTATDADLVMENNFRLSLRLLDWCTATRTPFIYASSAATYGDGAQGFDDDWSPAALEQLQADESLRLEQASVRPRGGRARRAQGEAAAAMGGLQVLQRVRPERVPQGRDDEPRRQALRRRQGRQAGPAVQVAPRRHRRRRAAARFHLCRRRGRGGALAARDAVGVRHLQCRHRQGAQLPRSDRRDVSRRSAARRTSNTSTCRTRSAASISISRRAEVENLRRAGYNAGFTPLEDARARATSPSSSTATTGTAESMFDFEKRLQSIGQQTILCVGDLMLDDFVYGDVSRISPEAPAPVLAVKRNEVVDRRRRQCGAQHRRARRALHLRRRGRRRRGRARRSSRDCRPSR